MDINDDEKKILRLARCTRNCYLHNDDKITADWLKAHANMPISPTNAYASGESVPGGMPHFKLYADTMVNITNRIETMLKGLPQ